MRNCEKQFYSMEFEKAKAWKELNIILNKSKNSPRNNLKCIIDCKTVLNARREIPLDLMNILQKLDKVCHQIYQVVLEVYMII